MCHSSIERYKIIGFKLYGSRQYVIIWIFFVDLLIKKNEFMFMVLKIRYDILFKKSQDIMRERERDICL